MTQNLHSPGPWLVEHPHREPGVYVGAANTALVAKLYPGDDGLEQTEANAALIAAAPELLEACEGFIAWLDFEGDVFEEEAIIERTKPLARAAIAKARGTADQPKKAQPALDTSWKPLDYPCPKCGGPMQYRVLNDDHGDERHACTSCSYSYVAEGPDA